MGSEYLALYRLRIPEDFIPITGKRKYQERNAGVEKENLRCYNFNRALLGVYNLAFPTMAAFSAWGLERLLETLRK